MFEFQIFLIIYLHLFHLNWIIMIYRFVLRILIKLLPNKLLTFLYYGIQRQRQSVFLHIIFTTSKVHEKY